MAGKKEEAEKVMPEVIAVLKSVLPDDHDLTDEDMTLILDKMTKAV